MASFGSSGGQQSVVIQGATNPTITNVSLPTADTEVEIVLPAGCKKFLIRMRDPQILKISFVSGQSGITYLTIRPGCVYSEDSLGVTTASLYIQSPATSQIVELVTWT